MPHDGLEFPPLVRLLELSAARPHAERRERVRVVAIDLQALVAGAWRLGQAHAREPHALRPAASAVGSALLFYA